MPGGRLALAAVLLLFFALSLYQVRLPGLYYDEAADAVPAMQLVLGQPVERVNDAGFTLWGVDFPVMVMDYVGAVNTYLLVPFFAALGPGVVAVRLMTIVAGALTVALTYLLARELGGQGVAIAAALLLASHPSFVFWTRQGIHVTSVMGVFAMGSLLLAVKSYRSGRRRHLWGAALLLGLGLSAKLLFLWWIVALAVAAALHPQTWTLLRRRPTMGRVGNAALFAALFLLGASMPIVYQLQTGGTWRAITSNAHTTSQGVDNTALFANLATRWDSFWVALSGEHLWYFGELHAQRLFPPAFLVAALAVAAYAVHGARRGEGWRGHALPLLLAGVVLLQSVVTISGLWPTHLYILLPLAALVAALGGRAVTALWPARWASAAVLTALAMLVAGNLLVDLRYHRILGQTGGRRSHSDAVYRLASYLDERGIGRPYALDWGIKTGVQVETQGRVNPIEVFGYTPQVEQPFRDWAYQSAQRQGDLYLFRTPEAAVFPRFDAFRETAAIVGKSPHLEATITERDGTPAFLVYTLE